MWLNLTTPEGDKTMAHIVIVGAGLGGVGDSKSMLESEMRNRDMKWITNAKTTRVEEGKMFVTQLDDLGNVYKEHEVGFKLSMMLPAFKGVDAVAAVPNLCNPRGCVD
jgi:sulfide:quinone oxidoreductase